jgi:hypothetical protein
MWVAPSVASPRNEKKKRINKKAGLAPAFLFRAANQRIELPRMWRKWADGRGNYSFFSSTAARQPAGIRRSKNRKALFPRPSAKLRYIGGSSISSSIPQRSSISSIRPRRTLRMTIHRA